MNTAWKDHCAPDLRTLKGKRVIVRVDWNVPVNNGTVTDASRIEVSVPFLQHLASAGAKIVILSHFGEKGESLETVAKYVVQKMPFITFMPSFDSAALEQASRENKEGSAILLENVRLFKGETDNDPVLADAFALLGDIFINDAFSVAHRTHASVVGLAERRLSYFGPTFERELENLTNALEPVQPALMLVGGAKSQPN
jgi:phosphoglycerate kinase